MNSSIFKSRRKCWDGCRAPTNDERLAVWALRYYGAGHHKGSHEVGSPEETPINQGSNAREHSLKLFNP